MQIITLSANNIIIVGNDLFIFIRELCNAKIASLILPFNKIFFMPQEFNFCAYINCDNDVLISFDPSTFRINDVQAQMTFIR